MCSIKIRLAPGLHPDKELFKDCLASFHNFQAPIGVVKRNPKEPVHVDEVGNVAHHLDQVWREDQRRSVRLIEINVSEGD